MAGKKKSVTVKRHKMIDEETENLVPAVETEEIKKSKVSRRMKSLYLVVALLALLALLFANKGLLVAAVVNGRPIWSWELNKTLTDRYGKQTLEGMISEKLIAEEANKKGVKITQADVTAKENSILKGLGENVKLDDLLQYQGISKSDFENQIRLQLTVQAILGKSITVTDDEVTNYISTNSASLTATEPAALKEEARQAIIDQKVNEMLQPWFSDLRGQAKILRFVN